MASVLVLMASGKGLQLANRLHEEGHIVKVWGVASDKSKLRIGNYMKLLEQYDLVLCDDPGLGTNVDELIQKERIVLGGGIVNDKLMLDKDYIGNVMNIVLPDLLCPVEVPDGIPLSITGYFGGGQYVLPFGYSFRYTRLMDGGKGPDYGSMGNVVWCVEEEDRIFGVTLKPLEELLRKVNYLGPISLELTVTEEELYFNRFITSFYYDVFQAWMELMRLSTFDYLYHVATKDTMVPYQREQYGISVSLRTMSLNGNVVDPPKEAMKHIWLEEGNTIGCITARGSDMRECRRRVYRTINNTVISPEVMYRSDIGKDAEAKLYQLKEWGWVS